MQVRRERVIDLEKAQEECGEKIREKYLGKELTVLVEEQKKEAILGIAKIILEWKF